MKIKRLLLVVTTLMLMTTVMAQVPYFSGTVGDGKLYGYTSLKIRPGINAQETYTAFQYGIGNYFATGVDLYTGAGTSYMGYLVRAGYKFSKWFGIGGQVTPSFDLNDSMKFSYLTSALYMNGNITDSGRLFWCSNTWWGVNKGAGNTMSQWTFLGYAIPIGKGRSFTPMIGEIHSWKMDSDMDIAAGFYYSVKKWNFYVWGNDFLKVHPRVVVGVDFVL